MVARKDNDNDGDEIIIPLLSLAQAKELPIIPNE
jgi:hypothetical protein